MSGQCRSRLLFPKECNNYSFLPRRNKIILIWSIYKSDINSACREFLFGFVTTTTVKSSTMTSLKSKLVTAQKRLHLLSATQKIKSDNYSL